MFSAPTSHVGEWYADPDSNHLKRQGEDAKVEPKVMKVLQCLAQSPGKVMN